MVGLQLTILGSGAWDAIPAPFCQCSVCLAGLDPKNKNHRTRPAIFVEGPEGCFLLELGPDIRRQSVQFKLPEISDFLVSHWHFDHLYGILELGAWSKFEVQKRPRLLCSKITANWARKNFGHVAIDVVEIQPYESFKLAGITIIPFPVRHFNEADIQSPLEVSQNTFGFLFEVNQKKVAYLADYYDLPEESRLLCSDLDLVIADGTYLFQDRFVDNNKSKMLSEDKDHLHGVECIRFIEKLRPRRTIFQAISHMPGLLHEEFVTHLPPDFEAAYDGMKISM